jgi:DNA-binding transcriptional LysR family regulator
LELRHLRAFVEVAANGHFGRAAAALSLTQPALTLRVQALEKELGADLFDRSGRVMRLTRAGEVLLPHAKRLVQVEDQALAEIKQHVAAKEGKLRVAYLTLWDGLPTNVVSMFRRRHPGVRIETTSGYSTANLERVVNREADLAFLTIGVGRRPGVVTRVLDRHPLVVIMAPNHHLAARVSVPVAELRGERFIGVSSGVNTAFAKDLSAWLTRHMGEPPRIVASEPPDQIASAVATSGGAVAVMTETRALVGESVGIVYRKLAPTPMIEYGIAFRKDNPSQPLADFIKAIDDSAPTITDGLLAGYEAVSRSSPARAASQNL